MFSQAESRGISLIKGFSYTSEKCCEQQKHKRLHNDTKSDVVQARRENSAFTHYKESAGLKNYQLFVNKQKCFFPFNEVIVFPR